MVHSSLPDTPEIESGNRIITLEYEHIHFWLVYIKNFDVESKR